MGLRIAVVLRILECIMAGKTLVQNKKLRRNRKPKRGIRPRREIKPNVRLSADVLPERYIISVAPDLNKFTFRGTEQIHLRLERPAKTITLHAKELKIDKAELVVGKRRVAVLRTDFDEKLETATFTFQEIIKKGKATLEFSFSGTLGDSLRGFYRSKYVTNGKEKYLATTQFEPTDARRAFPCFDEPDKKAVFEISLFAPKGNIAISNTLPIKAEPALINSTSINNKNNGVWYHFAPTPKMSSYLVAFVIGQFEYIERTSKEGVVMRIYCTPGKQKELQFALDAALKSLSFYNEYFSIPYPLRYLLIPVTPFPYLLHYLCIYWRVLYLKASAIVQHEILCHYERSPPVAACEGMPRNQLLDKDCSLVINVAFSLFTGAYRIHYLGTGEHVWPVALLRPYEPENYDVAFLDILNTRVSDFSHGSVSLAQFKIVGSG